MTAPPPDLQSVDPVLYAWEMENGEASESRKRLGLEPLRFPVERLGRGNPGPGPVQPWKHVDPRESGVQASAREASRPRQFGKGGRKSTWTDPEIEIVRTEYPIYRAARQVGALAARLNRPAPTVRQKAIELGVANVGTPRPK